MIIECPACATRYDIKTAFPADGRTVRCAKCSTVWRAMPNAVAEQAASAVPSAAPEEEKQAPVASVTTSQPEEDAEFSGSPEPSAPPMQFAREDQPSQDTAFFGRFAPGAAAEEARRSNEREEAAPEDFGLQVVPPAADDRETGKVSWFGSFRRKNRPDDAEPADRAGPRSVSAETIPFPRPSMAEERVSSAPPGEPLETLEDARAAVRSVFSSLADARPASQGRSFAAAAVEGFADTQNEQSLADAGQRYFNNSPDAEAPAGDGWESDREYSQQQYRDDSEAQAEDVEAVQKDEYGQAELTSAADGSDDWNGHDGDHEDPQPSPSWRGGGAISSEAYAQEIDEQVDTDAAAHARDILERIGHQGFSAENTRPIRYGEDKLAQELESRLRSNAPHRAPYAEETPQDDDYVPAEDVAFDDRLYRDIERTQEHSGDALPSRHRGGLALAAGWGLFLCAASGLVIGFLAFRDIVADSLPGLVPVYRMIGMPVTVQPLIFESVQYKWAMSENKPVVVISGSVYNRSQRKVKAPEFFITIKDQNPELDREYSANLPGGGSKIKGGRRTDFEIELLSPNPTITAIELELRNVH